MKHRVAIIGATGYGGGELLRFLLHHPSIEVTHATSRSRAGQSVGVVHRQLLGLTELTFSAPAEDELLAQTDVIIGALPHGASAEVLAPYIRRGHRVVDLSGDFRLRDLDVWKRWYRREHPHPELVEEAVYGCPEYASDAIRSSRLVASPGCFATAMNLALLPAARAGLLTGRVAVVGMTGSSGSGAEARQGTHHPERSQTLRPYKVLAHQHVPEVLQLCDQSGSPLEGVDFTPVSAPLVRGILVIAQVRLTDARTTTQMEELYSEFGARHPFVKVITSREPECASVAGTNYAEIRPRVTEGGVLHAVCALDNLVKGGAGQAVQSLNLMLGLPETEGLDWPGMWP